MTPLPKASPGGEAVERSETDEECGQKTSTFTSVSGVCSVSDLAVPHPSSKSPVPAAFESTFPPGEGIAFGGGKKTSRAAGAVRLV